MRTGMAFDGFALTNEHRTMVVAEPSPAAAALEVLEVPTTAPLQFVDITDSVARLVRNLGCWSGTATVFSRHTTAAIRLQENEPLLLDDLRQLLLRLAPPDAVYGHNNFERRTEHMHPDERPNGNSHCLHLLLGSSEHIPVANGTLMLGEWQRVFLVELDGPRPGREVLVQMTGVMTAGARW